MAVSLGVNSGFVTERPVVDPGGTGNGTDGVSRVTQHVTPTGTIKIIEMGWYCDNATQESNFEVGIYAADGAVVPGEAGTLLFASQTNAKGTDAGWKVVTGLNWDLNPETNYWLAIQVDDTATQTNVDGASVGGLGQDFKGATTLTNPHDGGALLDSDGMLAIYALIETSSGAVQYNLGNSFNNISSNH